MNIGQKLKDLRQVCGLTQLEVADRLELTKGYISQIEKNTTSPNMKVFLNLLNVYNITPQDFFGAKEKEEVVVISKTHEFNSIHDDNLKNDITDLVRTRSSFSCEIVEIEPDGKTPIITKHIGEEFGYILTGKLDLIYDTKRYTLEKGDSFYFPAIEDHEFKNTYSKDVKFIWFKTPKK